MSNIHAPFKHYIFILFALALLSPLACFGEPVADKVLVIKSEHALYLMKNGEAFATFHVVFGGNPEGHKQQQGDQRTPEGEYTLGYKNSNSRYYKSIHISYPNAQDRAQARQRGVRPGGDIMIHGQPNGKEWLTPFSQMINWTNGCIALTNSDMDIVWDAVRGKTPIEIRP
jgi:murein L,D-transpeptidase YafK